MKYCFGIISWLPNDHDRRNKRIDRLNRLLSSINSLFPDTDILIVAQNWLDYNPSNSNLIIFKYDKLGILKARKTLRERFLESNYDYLIMCDDDCIIEGNPYSFLEGLKSHPNGFAYREDNEGNSLPSQFNLFAISRFIYEREDMVDIDPQKNEGFEDDIFTELLHNKYSQYQWHFSDLKASHFKNPDIDKLGGEVPSTWAQEQNKHDWLKLRTNNMYILKRIKEGCFDISQIRIELGLDKSDKSEIIDFDIDLVFPYLNDHDPVWRKSFENFCKLKGLYSKINSEKQRYDDPGFLKYLLRSVDMNMPWIRKVHIIVSNIEQIPSWLDQSKVHVVLHKDIIAPKFLPTFNSTTIEMYLRHIEGLSEHFIYANDDMYFLNKLEKNDFFSASGLPKSSFLTVSMNNKSSQFDKVCWNNYHDLLKVMGKTDDNKITYRPDHTAVPYRKSTLNTVCNIAGSVIWDKIGSFRTSHQHNQYIYNCYEKINNSILPDSIKFKYTTTKTNIEDIINILRDDYQIVCINDVMMNNRHIWENNKYRLVEEFKTKFPNKSKYEV